jgi:hypothetical protein
LRLRVRNDFGLSIHSELPSLGSASEGLRAVSGTWSDNLDSLRLDLSGRPGKTYELDLWNPAQVRSVDGGTLPKSDQPRLQISFPAGAGQEYLHQQVVIHFVERR